MEGGEDESMQGGAPVNGHEQANKQLACRSPVDKQPLAVLATMISSCVWLQKSSRRMPSLR